MPSDPHRLWRNAAAWTGGAVGLALAGAAAAAAQGRIEGVPSTRWIDVAMMAFLVGALPFVAVETRRRLRTRGLDARLPDLLDDLASNHRSGLTVPASITVAAAGSYGALTAHVRTMSAQLSWNVPVDEVLAGFARAAPTQLVERTVQLIREASRAGGQTAAVLTAASDEARRVTDLRRRRAANMALYASIVYVTFLVAVAVVALLYSAMLPDLLQARVVEGLARGDAGASDAAVVLERFRGLYLFVLGVVGIGSGVVVAQMTGRGLSGGLQHAVAMVAIAYAAIGAVSW